MTLLPALDGTTEGTSPALPLDINNQGRIVGQSFAVDDSGDSVGGTPSLWQDGEPMALPAVTAYGEVARHVNEPGQVLVDSHHMPYLWTDGEVTPLPVPNWEVVDVNDRGQVLIQLDAWNAALWEDGELIPVRPPGDDPLEFVVRDLSEAGHVVGEVWSPGEWSGAFIWQDGTFTRLGAGDPYVVNRSGQVIAGGMLWEPDGTATRLGFEGTDLNDRGQVVGTRIVGGVEQAVLWEDGRLTELGTLGGESSAAQEINELGQVVGVSATPDDPWHNFLWVDGQMIDLGESWTDYGPYDINDRGQIIGRIGHIEDGARVGSAVLWQVHDRADAPG